MRHLDRADRFPVDQITERAGAADYDAVVLPGGVANPDHLRTDGAAVDFLMAMFEAGKPLAAICHGPWTQLRGTSWGAAPHLVAQPADRPAQCRRDWVDRDVVVCRLGINTLVTSRGPDYLGAFCRDMTAASAPSDLLV